MRSSGSIQIALTNEDNLFYGIIFGVIGKFMARNEGQSVKCIAGAKIR